MYFPSPLGKHKFVLFFETTSQLDCAVQVAVFEQQQHQQNERSWENEM